jgi:hypothetical protein
MNFIIIFIIVPEMIGYFSFVDNLWISCSKLHIYRSIVLSCTSKSSSIKSHLSITSKRTRKRSNFLDHKFINERNFHRRSSSNIILSIDRNLHDCILYLFPFRCSASNLIWELILFISSNRLCFHYTCFIHLFATIAYKSASEISMLSYCL